MNKLILSTTVALTTFTVLILVLMPAKAIASGPSYNFWFNYGATPNYNPDLNARNNQSQLFYGSIPMVKTHSLAPKKSNLRPTKISPGEALQNRLLAANAQLKKLNRPLEFIVELQNDYRRLQIKRSGEQQYQVSLSKYGRSNHGWGICGSNTLDNVLLLLEQTAKIKDISHQQLADWLAGRLAIFEHCTSEKLANISLNENNRTPPAAQPIPFKYNDALVHFYQKQYFQAIEHFNDISSQANPWFSELAQYLIGRSYLLDAQANWSGYRFNQDQIDQDQLTKALAQFKKYQQQYPNGSYIKSVTRLMRKTYRLQDDNEKFQQHLSAELRSVVNQIFNTTEFTPIDTNEIAGFIRVFENQVADKTAAIKLLTSIVENPNYSSQSNHPLYNVLQRLKRFSQAQTYYQQGQYQQAINIIEPINQAGNHILILLAKSWHKLGNMEQSNQIWQDIAGNQTNEVRREVRREITDTQIANNLLEQGGLKALLTSPIDVADDIYQLNLALACSIEQVKPLLNAVTQPQRKHWIIYDLAMRYIDQNNIGALHQLLKSYSAAQLKDLEMIKTAARMVATKTDLSKGYLNIAFFLENKARRPMLKYKHSLRYWPDPSVVVDIPNTAPKQCQQLHLTTTSHDPYYYYQQALEHAKSPSTLEAKTLNFLVKCFKTQSFLNACRWSEYTPSRVYGNYQQNGQPSNQKDNPSKQWFQTLHRKYPDSKWSKKTPYHY